MVKIYKKVHYPGLVKSRQKNGRDSQSRETDGGEKIAATSTYICTNQSFQNFQVRVCIILQLTSVSCRIYLIH